MVSSQILTPHVNSILTSVSPQGTSSLRSPSLWPPSVIPSSTTRAHPGAISSMQPAKGSIVESIMEARSGFTTFRSSRKPASAKQEMSGRAFRCPHAFERAGASGKSSRIAELQDFYGLRGYRLETLIEHLSLSRSRR